MLAEEPARDFKFAGAFRPLGKIILKIAEQSRRRGITATDFFGRLMEARGRARGKPMPNAQLVREIMALVVAGHETTAGQLNWLWYRESVICIDYRSGSQLRYVGE